MSKTRVSDYLHMGCIPSELFDTKKEFSKFRRAAASYQVQVDDNGDEIELRGSKKDVRAVIASIFDRGSEIYRAAMRTVQIDPEYFKYGHGPKSA